MQISTNGLGLFKFTAKEYEGDVSVVTDVYGDKAGMKAPRAISADMVLSSHEGPYTAGASEVSAATEGTSVFSVVHAGEYEVRGVFVRGIHAPRKDGSSHTLYRIAAEGMRIGFLGALDRPLKEKEIEALGDIHILIVPVGGGNVATAKLASELVAQVEPRIVIPSYYSDGSIDNLDTETSFCSEIACPREDQSKLAINKSQLPAEDMQLIVLS